MGRLLNIPHFRSERSIEDEKSDNAAFRRAKKAEEVEALRQAQLASVRRMHNHFLGHIIRRTTDSLSWDGKTSLLDLPAHVDISGVLKLSQRELDIIQSRAEDARSRCVLTRRPSDFLFTLNLVACLQETNQGNFKPRYVSVS